MEGRNVVDHNVEYCHIVQKKEPPIISYFLAPKAALNRVYIVSSNKHCPYFYPEVEQYKCFVYLLAVNNVLVRKDTRQDMYEN